jgi:Rps23 Pro-64 3,4-dihydroxylase Tpa1-like proline 4-hydroxylase
MNYTIYKEPFVHIIFDDVFPWAISLQFRTEIEKLIPFMTPGIVNSDRGNVVAPSYKMNKNIWLFQFFKAHNVDKNMATTFEKYMWSEKMKDIIKETNDSLFRSLLYTDSSQLLLSSYEEGGHYAWHRDYNPTVSINYMYAKQPQKFKGGDFIFGTWDEKVESKRVEFKNNRMVMFPSRVWHMVEPVTDFTGDATEARFTLQYWSKLKDTRES